MKRMSAGTGFGSIVRLRGGSRERCARSAGDPFFGPERCRVTMAAWSRGLGLSGARASGLCQIGHPTLQIGDLGMDTLDLTLLGRYAGFAHGGFPARRLAAAGR